MYRIGDKVVIVSDNDNYDRYRDLVLIVTHVANNEQEHRGYDDSVNEQLLDLEVESSGEDVPFSLYEYEVESI